MTSYHGGKKRIGKKLSNTIHIISDILEKETRFIIKGYCEPFCGMLGVFQHIPELYSNHSPKLVYKAGDTNKSVIMMWKKAQKGWKPPVKTTEKEYNKLKNSTDSALKGYIGHQYSFGGAFFNGFAPKYGKNSNSKTASNRIVKISKELKNVNFKSGTYTQYSQLKNYIIYCDPPYESTVSRYYNKKKLSFNTEKFWEWCRKMAKHNIVFISSYNAPKDFVCIFESSHKLTGISPGKNKKDRVEKLYLKTNLVK